MKILNKKKLQSILDLVFKTGLLCFFFAIIIFLIGITNSNTQENEVDYLAFLIILGILFLIIFVSKIFKNKLK